ARHREGSERTSHDDGDLGLEVRRQSVPRDNVDVCLVELAETTLLGALPAPDLLNLIPAERKVQLALSLLDVASEGHGEIKVKAELSVGRVAATPSEDINLFRRLGSATEKIERLHSPRLDLGEAVEFEDRAQRRQHGR